MSIGYDDLGTGLPVVFIHGFPHDRSLWASQFGALAVPARTLAPDLRGFGESAGEARSVGDYAGDIAAWLGELDIRKAVVVGISMGGYVAFSLWRSSPSLIRALVLTGTRAGADDVTGRAKRDEQIAFVKSRGSAELADQLVQSMVGKTTRASRPELVEGVHSMLARAPVRGVVGALTAMRDRPDSTPTLRTIDVPTLIVVGDEDVLTPVAESRSMHAAIEGSRLEIVAGAGHLTPVERPAAYNHILNEFLSSLAYM
jgi:pimeloyl-ACP methyl ester carboxylesterase